MKKEDVPFVSDLIKRVFVKTVKKTLEPEGVANFRKGLSHEAIESRYNADSIFVVARDAEKLIGVGEIRRKNHLHTLYVDLDFQRQGIGREILSELNGYIDGPEITVDAALNSVDAYLNFGFVTNGPADIYKGIRCQPMVYKF